MRGGEALVQLIYGWAEEVLEVQGNLSVSEAQALAVQEFTKQIVSAYNKLIDYGYNVQEVNVGLYQMGMHIVDNTDFFVDSMGRIVDATDGAADGLEKLGAEAQRIRDLPLTAQAFAMRVIDWTEEVFREAFDMSNAQDIVEAQALAWGVFGGELIETYNNLVRFRQVIPSLLELMVQYGLEHGKIIQDLNGVVSSVEERGCELNRQAADLGKEIVAFRDTLINSELMSDPLAQQEVLETFGDRVTEMVTLLREFGLGVPVVLDRLAASLESGSRTDERVLLEDLFAWVDLMTKEKDIGFWSAEEIAELQAQAWRDFGELAIEIYNELKAQRQAIDWRLAQVIEEYGLGRGLLERIEGGQVQRVLDESNIPMAQSGAFVKRGGPCKSSY